jgi:PAS domain S-box-containing protein
MNPAPYASPHRRLSIRAQLLALVLAVVLPALGLVGYNLVGAANEARQAAHGQVQGLAQDLASRLERILRDNEALLARLAERPRIKALDARDCEPSIAEFVSLHPEYTTLGLRDRDANAVCTFLRPAPGAERVREYPWFAEGLRRGRFMVGESFLDPQSGRWVLPLTHPVRDASANASGLLLVTLDLPALQQRVLGALPEETIVVVFDRENRFLMRSIEAADWIGKPLPRAQLERLPARSEDVFELTGVDGVARLNAGAIVPASGWRVYAGLPKDRVLAGYRERLKRSVAFGLLVLLLALGLAYRLGSVIARPIGELARSAAEQDWQASARAGGVLFETVHRRKDGGIFPVEISARAIEVAGKRYRQSFARDISARRRAEAARGAAERETQRAYERFEKVFLGAPEAMSISEMKRGRLLAVNDAFCATFGRAREELIGRSALELGLWTDASRRDALVAALAAGRTVRGVEGQTRRRSGELREVLYSAETIQFGGDACLLLMFTDITERKLAEEKLRERLEELLRWQELMIGREERMRQLKAEVNELLARQGQPPRYGGEAEP